MSDLKDGIGRKKALQIINEIIKDLNKFKKNCEKLSSKQKANAAVDFSLMAAYRLQNIYKTNSMPFNFVNAVNLDEKSRHMLCCAAMIKGDNNFDILNYMYQFTITNSENYLKNLIQKIKEDPTLNLTYKIKTKMKYFLKYISSLNIFQVVFAILLIVTSIFAINEYLIGSVTITELIKLLIPGK